MQSNRCFLYLLNIGQRFLQNYQSAIIFFPQMMTNEVNLNLKPQTITPQEAASSSSVASQSFYDNVHNTENTESQQERHHATTEKKE